MSDDEDYPGLLDVAKSTAKGVKEGGVSGGKKVYKYRKSQRKRGKARKNLKKQREKRKKAEDGELGLLESIF